MQDMTGLLKQAQEMQAKMTRLQEDLAQKTVEGVSGGGIVRVVCTGRQELLSVRIDPGVVDPADVDMLQDLVLAAANDALRHSRAMMETEMAALTGGLKLPFM
jgi:DNA-binding YbaB/EbfC family protein